ncbi:peroxiredoxin [Leucothrix sargassi]|nr:peroxiredoxin [Leucothrix sargassi]
MIKVGDKLPKVNVTSILNDETSNSDTETLFTNKKVVLFAVPGAFTPTCSRQHLPGYVTHIESFKEKGIDSVMCLSVNDAFVMSAWALDQNAESIMMIADGGASFTKALGLDKDTGDFGGTRAQRFAMVVDNGEVTYLAVEPPKEFNTSSAEHVLSTL